MVEEPRSFSGRIDDLRKGKDGQPEFLGPITNIGNRRKCAISVVDLTCVGTGEAIKCVPQPLQRVVLLGETKLLHWLRPMYCFDYDGPIPQCVVHTYDIDEDHRAEEVEDD